MRSLPSEQQVLLLDRSAHPKEGPTPRAGGHPSPGSVNERIVPTESLGITRQPAHFAIDILCFATCLANQL